MNASKLRIGDILRSTDPTNAKRYRVVERRAHARLTACHVPEYEGLNGADDRGHVHISDWDMSRKFVLVSRAGGAK